MQQKNLLGISRRGVELRPIRHWTKYAIIGAIVIAFLAESIINLTLLSCKNPLVKNVKLIKKFLTNLTPTSIYPEGRFKFQVVSNISAQMHAIFRDFLGKYRTEDLNLRW
jgi:hypothetical protein